MMHVSINNRAESNRYIIVIIYINDINKKQQLRNLFYACAHA